MKREYDAKGVPMIVIEKPDAKITITFNETPTDPDLKGTILELLSNSYEKEFLRERRDLHILRKGHIGVY